MSFSVSSPTVHLAQSQSDDRLVERLSHKDPTAFEELYCIFGKRVHTTIYRIVRNHVVAEDLSQEVFLKAWSRANEFERGTSRSLVAWLNAVARNRSIDYLRSTEGRFTRASRELTRTDRIAGQYNAEERIAMSRQMARLELAVGKLDEDRRRVVGLIYFEGLTHAEAASHQSRPLGTIKSWVRQALVALRRDLVNAG